MGGSKTTESKQFSAGKRRQAHDIIFCFVNFRKSLGETREKSLETLKTKRKKNKKMKERVEKSARK